jgi:Gram-negative bacterial TonB protein C-terminal
MSITQNPVYMFRKSVPARFAPTSPSFAVSFLLHCSFAFLLFHLPQAFSSTPELEVRDVPKEIYYVVPMLDSSKTLPHIAVPKMSARVPSVSKTGSRSASNSAIFQGTLAIISKPARPDNTRQTILQPNTPPDIHIAVELKLPNVIMQMPSAPSPKAPLPVDAENARPLARRQRTIDAEVPQIPLPASALTPTAYLPNPSDSQPQLPVPSFPVAKPVLAQRETSYASAIPALPNPATPEASLPGILDSQAQPPIPSFSVAKPVPAHGAAMQASLPVLPGAPAPKLPMMIASGSQSKLPMPSVTVAKPVPTRRPLTEASTLPAVPNAPTAKPLSPDFSDAQPKLPMPSFAVAKAAPAQRATANPNGVPVAPNVGELVIIGVDPSPAVSQIVLPPGTRLGTFAISPATKSPASSGGTPGTSAAGNQEASLRGEDEKAVSGDSGAKTASTGTLIVGSPESGKSEAPGALGPPLPPDMIFPVKWESPFRKNTMVVSTGPTGGGGLSVYGILDCGKIYTIFLPMPGKNWTMQYCAEPASPQDPPAVSDSVVVHWGKGIVPPEPESKFDFRRLAIPHDMLGKMIVLKGILKADGTVVDLQVYRGTTPEMNEAARVAFGRWKFKPALRNGVPVPVQLLIGIPPEVQ